VGPSAQPRRVLGSGGAGLSPPGLLRDLHTSGGDGVADERFPLRPASLPVVSRISAASSGSERDAARRLPLPCVPFYLCARGARWLA